MKNSSILLVCILFLTLALSACGSTQGGAGTLEQSATQAAQGESANVAPSPSPGNPSATTALSPADIGSTSTETVPDSIAPTAARPVKTELEASDPLAVSLASGQVHLVEFFAFW